MSQQINPRFLAFMHSLGLTTLDELPPKRTVARSGFNAEYICWINENVAAFRKLVGKERYQSFSEAEHDEFDAYLRLISRKQRLLLDT